MWDRCDGMYISVETVKRLIEEHINPNKPTEIHLQSSIEEPFSDTLERTGIIMTNDYKATQEELVAWKDQWPKTIDK